MQVLMMITLLDSAHRVQANAVAEASAGRAGVEVARTVSKLLTRTPNLPPPDELHLVVMPCSRDRGLAMALTRAVEASRKGVGAIGVAGIAGKTQEGLFPAVLGLVRGVRLHTDFAALARSAAR